MNKKGFVLAETLVVTIFVLLIFTVLYNNIVPLLGRYEEISYYNSVDVTYDLYQYKKLLENDPSFSNIIANDYKILTCDEFSDINKCDTIDSLLNKDEDDMLIYLNTSNIDSLKADNSVSLEIKDYLEYLKFDTSISENILVLSKDNYISYLYLKLPEVPSISIKVLSGTTYSSGYKNDLVLEVSCTAYDGIASFSTTVNGTNAGTITENTSSSQVKNIVMNDAGTNKLVVGTCTSNTSKTATSSARYTVYVYSQNSSCSCKTYRTCASSYCGTTTKTTYSGSCKCLYYGQTTTFSCNATRYTEVSRYGGCNKWCKAINSSSSTGSGSCNKRTTTQNKSCPAPSCGCKTRNQCWHT